MSETVFDAIVSHDLAALAGALEDGANPNELLTKFPWRTPLQEAVEQLEEGGNLGTLSLLIQHGAHVDAKDGRGDSTALYMAVCRSNTQAVEFLLKAGADPNIRSSEGESPLSRSIDQGDLAMAKLLLQQGAKKTINDPAGNFLSMNALGVALQQLDLAAVTLLLDSGADPLIRDADGRTALEVLGLASNGDVSQQQIIAQRLHEYITRSA